MNIKHMNVTQLRTHPLSEKIYGDSFDKELIESIDKHGILTPLRITNRNVIVSGHRRYKAAIELCLPEVPVVYCEFDDELEIEKEVIHTNRQRQKTNEQKTREYIELKRIESEKARKRQVENLKQNQSDDNQFKQNKKTNKVDGWGKPTGNDNLTQSSVRPNLDERKTANGRSDDLAAKEIGMKRTSAETAAKVITTIDTLKESGQTEEAKTLTDTLNTSINKAFNESKKYQPPPEVIQEQKQKESNNKNGSSKNGESIKPPKAVFNQTNENIDWAKWTWNPVTGCLHDCPYCYARDIANRFYEHKFEPHFYPERLDAPTNTKIPSDPNKQSIGWKNVFTCSMADLFGKWVPNEWIDKIMDSVRSNPQWNYLFLTKYPHRLSTIDWPSNCWVGVTIDKKERIKTAERTFEKIKSMDHQPDITFISFEPLLERITIDLTNVDWIIIGGQSRSSQTPEFQPEWEWVEHLIFQARQHNCKIFMKPNLTVRAVEYPYQ